MVPPSTAEEEAFRRHIADAITNGPTGLLLIGASVDMDVEVSPTDVFDELSHRLHRHVRDEDLLVHDEPGRWRLVRSDLRGPSEVEGLAFTVQSELAKPVIVHDRAIRCSVAVGAATTVSGDDAATLGRHARHAFEDAELLGGDRVVAFDDLDRDLLVGDVPDEPSR